MPLGSTLPLIGKHYPSVLGELKHLYDQSFSLESDEHGFGSLLPNDQTPEYPASLELTVARQLAIGASLDASKLAPLLKSGLLSGNVCAFTVRALPFLIDCARTWSSEELIKTILVYKQEAHALDSANLALIDQVQSLQAKVRLRQSNYDGLCQTITRLRASGNPKMRALVRFTPIEDCEMHSDGQLRAKRDQFGRTIKPHSIEGTIEVFKDHAAQYSLQLEQFKKDLASRQKELAVSFTQIDALNAKHIEAVAQYKNLPDAYTYLCDQVRACYQDGPLAPRFGNAVPVEVENALGKYSRVHHAHFEEDIQKPLAQIMGWTANAGQSNARQKARTLVTWVY